MEALSSLPFVLHTFELYFSPFALLSSYLFQYRVRSILGLTCIHMHAFFVNEEACSMIVL